MIPFPFNESRFSFFVADHQQVGQLCTNPKSDRSLLLCLKETWCSTSEIGNAPLYNACSLPIQVMTIGPLPAPSKCKSGRFNAWGCSSTHRTTLTRWWSGRPHHATSHLRSRLESQHQSVAGCAEECGDPLVQSGGRLPVADPKCGSRTRRWATSPKRPRLGCWRIATTLWPSLTGPLLPPPELAGLLHLVIRREHHQHDLPQHQSQPDRRHPPSIRRAPAGACGKMHTPSPDPYRGGHWRWSSTT